MAVTVPKSVEQGRARRAATADQRAAKVEWFIKEVSENIRLPLKKRVQIATQFLQDRIVKNISVSVIIISKNGRSYTDETSRSAPGEFPRAETTQLMKSIFSEVREPQQGIIEGYVGTPIDYGVILELEMDRSFMVRTLNEEQTKLIAIMTGPIT